MIDADFIATARRLADTPRGRPRQTDLRRAVSTAYYAMFHCLAICCADTLVGGVGSNRNEQAWRRTYRALQHGVARRRCLRQREIADFPGPVQAFAGAFVHTQEMRHEADYNPHAEFTKSDVIRIIARAEDAISDFSAVGISDRRAFAIHVLFDHNR